MRTWSWMLVFFLLGAGTARPQNAGSLDAIQQRLEKLERQNAELLDEIRSLRGELNSLKPPSARLDAVEEQLQLQAGRVAEQEQVKVESTQKAPVRLTGMLLFNAFRNTAHGGAADNPTTAQISSGPVNAGGTLRQSVVGLEFDGPEGILGGKFTGSFLLDLFSATGAPLNTQVRLRTASVQGQWATRGFLVGQEKPIFAPREPNSLAQVGVSPLTSAGNLWRWRPQVRFEQRLRLGSGLDFQGLIGVSQTSEEVVRGLPAQFASTLEQKRPALEGHFQFGHHFDDTRRVEFAPGFHWSTTHVAGASVPSSAFSLDWFVNPHRRLEFTGALFTGKNLANLGAGGVSQGFTILAPRPGEIQVIPVRSQGGWAQLTFLATSRLSFNVYGGEDDPNNRDLPATGIAKNLSYAANVFYRLAHNVVAGAEVSRVRTQFLSGPHPANSHYDLSLAYLF